MTNGNGKKRPEQLDQEIAEALAGRGTEASSLPSQAEYERREFQEAQRRLIEVERAPLADRKEAASAFFELMRDDPELVAERIGWLLDGNYGYGQMQMAKRVLGSPRMNRSAALTHMIAALEWSSPSAMTREAWKKLTAGEKARLERAVQAVIRGASRGGRIVSVPEAPVYKGFEYRVRLAVSIPLAWAEFLRAVALQHYDWWCKESARAGVVNALCNTACDSEHPSSYPVAWRDLDLLAKIMEQAQYQPDTGQKWELIAKIDAWIDQAKAWLIARQEALAKWDIEQETLMPSRPSPSRKNPMDP